MVPVGGGGGSPAPAGFQGVVGGPGDAVEIDAAVGHDLRGERGKLAAGEKVAEAPEADGGVVDAEGARFDGDGAVIPGEEGAADGHHALGAGGVVLKEAGEIVGAAAGVARAGEVRRLESGHDRGGEFYAGREQFAGARQVGRGVLLWALAEAGRSIGL